MDDRGFSRAPYAIEGRPDLADPGELAGLAQEAEFLHAETGRQHKVLDADGDVVYESKGAPE